MNFVTDERAEEYNKVESDMGVMMIEAVTQDIWYHEELIAAVGRHAHA